ncbi:hypothetical protein EV421DRAFT_1893382 [Armillaria borealis]|uniref:CxC2-like cysteine cluster KDZ transposase-associated domain-containing protein n=1 Tax=Armillaria borealis TaxID=47425 RepID=A0AA39MEY2_9AGAR|nr:hypothetical protein EV421DRAFT_1893382 [Armillaria borealis]
MLNYHPKKHGQARPAREFKDKDKDDEPAPPPQLDRYQHTQFSLKRTSTRSSACTMTLSLPSLGLHHPSTAIEHPHFVPELLPSSFLDPDYAPSAELLGRDEEHSSTRAPRPLGNHPLHVWCSQRSVFLNEMLKLDAFEDDGDDRICDACTTSPGIYRCLSCTCIVDEHACSPLHRIEECFQLGHKLGMPCPSPVIITKFVVIDVDSIHTVNMAFCDCSQGIERHVSAYEFYHTLARVTDNSGMYMPPFQDHYQTFLRVVREWRHIHALKQFGCGHEPGGIEGTCPGELTLHCLACPQPSINLPPNWRDNISRCWLYRLFLGINANFRLRQLNVSSNDADPGLNEGYAYFVEECAFRTHLDTFGKIIPEEEKSTCNNHDAVKLANSRGGQGSAAMGVGAVVCAWHNMKRPLSVGDLQKGERYLNIDYFMLSTLTCDSPLDLVVSYDIACQWHKNFFSQISKYPEHLRPEQLEQNILYLVPKFHLPTHILLCRDNFSFNFSSKVGHTDGEALECGWAATNALASSTKEMGPGSHRDTLDDHFGDYNWRKIIILHTSFLVEHMKVANAWSQADTLSCLEHVTEFISYEEALKADHSASVELWKQMVLQWEQDQTQPNPFLPRLRSVTETAVCLELAREEKSVSLVEIHHDISPSKFIAQGLQLEEAQVQLQDDMNILGSHTTDLQRSKVQTQANHIGRKIDAWIDIQKVYMPRTTLLWVRDDDHCPADTEVHPSKIPLYLPSAALKLNAVNPTTQITTKIAADVAWYQRIYAALDTVLTKSNRFEWQGVLFPLKDGDVHGLDQYNESISEGHCNLSWIWKTNLQGGDEGLQEALRIEWCKSCA